MPDNLRNRDGAKMDYHPRQTGGGQVMQDWRDANPPQTTGWSPSCGCGAGVAPATVLDPFVGSGTTAAVAQSLGRRGLGLDLNPEYLDLAVRRLSAVPLSLF